MQCTILYQYTICIYLLVSFIVVYMYILYTLYREFRTENSFVQKNKNSVTGHREGDVSPLVTQAFTRTAERYERRTIPEGSFHARHGSSIHRTTIIDSCQHETSLRQQLLCFVSECQSRHTCTPKGKLFLIGS